MVFLEYGFDRLPSSFVCESGRPARWPYQVKRQSPSDAAYAAVSLEDEIRTLRREMEDAFLESESLTSDVVVKISRMLDVKINEYMKCNRRN